MRAHRTALLCLAAALTMASDGVFAQKMGGRGPSNVGMSRPQNIPDGPSKGGGGYPAAGIAGPAGAASCPASSSGCRKATPQVHTLLMTARQGRAARRQTAAAQAARRQRMSAGSCPMKSSSRSPIQSAHNRSKRCSAGTG